MIKISFGVCHIVWGWGGVGPASMKMITQGPTDSSFQLHLPDILWCFQFVFMLQTLTTWVNKVLKDTDAESVVDLRKCVGDGVTLVKLAEKTCKCMHVQEVVSH